MATRATSVPLLLLLSSLHIALGSAVSSSGEARGGRLIRSEPVLARVRADGRVAGQREEEGPQQEPWTSESTMPDDDEQAAGDFSTPMFGASMTAVQLHGDKEAVKETQLPDYLVLAKQWADAASVINATTTAAANKVFGQTVDVSTSNRFYTLATALPRYLSLNVLNIQYSSVSSGSRLAYTVPQPRARYEWLVMGTSATKLDIFLCPLFFNKPVQTQAAILLHEVFHHLSCNDLPAKSLFDTNTWVSYVLDVAFNSKATLSGGSPRLSMDCTRLPGMQCFNDFANGNCFVIAMTTAGTCAQYCQNYGMYCENSWNTADALNLCYKLSSTPFSDFNTAMLVDTEFRRLPNPTFCSARVTLAPQQVCVCTREDLIGTMDVSISTTPTTTPKQTTTSISTSTTKRR